MEQEYCWMRKGKRYTKGDGCTGRKARRKQTRTRFSGGKLWKSYLALCWCSPWRSPCSPAAAAPARLRRRRQGFSDTALRASRTAAFLSETFWYSCGNRWSGLRQSRFKPYRSNLLTGTADPLYHCKNGYCQYYIWTAKRIQSLLSLC